MHRCRTNVERGAESARRGTGLIGRVHRRRDARILHLAVPRVAREAAGSQHHAAGRAVEDLLAGLVFHVVARKLRIELVVGTRSDAHDAARFVHDEAVHLCAVADRHVRHLLEGFKHRKDVAGAVARRRLDDARGGVTAADAEMRVVHDAAVLAKKRHDIVATVDDDVKEFRVVETETVREAVLHEDVARILHAEF